MNKFTLAAIAVILISFGGLVLWSSLNNKSEVDLKKYDPVRVIPASNENDNMSDHVRGKADAKVVVVEYGDFTCPGCASMAPKMDLLYKQYGDRVAFIYRNFSVGHTNSLTGIAAGQSAARQGYFWEMERALFGNQSSWIAEKGEARTQAFVKLFKQAAPKGDEDKFKRDLADPSIMKKPNFDKMIGSKLQNISQTPSFLINGTHIEINEKNTDKSLTQIIEEAINKELKAKGLETGAK